MTKTSLGIRQKVHRLRINNVLYSPLTLLPFKDYFTKILALKFDFRLTLRIIWKNLLFERMNFMSKSLVIKDFRTLKVWQKANALEQEIEALVKVLMLPHCVQQ